MYTTRFLRLGRPIITKTITRSIHTPVLTNELPTKDVEKSYPEMKAAFFSPEKNRSWMNTKENLNEFMAYLDQLFNDLIIPHYIRQIDTPDIEVVKRRFIDLMLEDLSYEMLKTLDANWKKDYDEIENKKQGNFTNHAWESKDLITMNLIYRAYEGYLPPKLTAENYEMMVHYAELNDLYKSEEEFYTDLKSYKIW